MYSEYTFKSVCFAVITIKFCIYTTKLIFKKKWDVCAPERSYVD